MESEARTRTRRPPVVRPAGREESAHVPGYSENRLWTKLQRYARSAGREVVEKALWLFYASQRPDVPRWAKLTIYGALAYFILPLDALPDFLPALGYGDDLAALTAALVTVASFVDDNVKERTRRQLARWFGEAESRA